MKKCTKCGIEKELDEFHKDRHAPDGHVYKCKVCIRSHRSRPEVKERIAKSNAKYNARHEVKERRAKYFKEYNARPEVKERIAKSRAEYLARPEVKERRAKYFKEYNTRPEAKEGLAKSKAKYKAKIKAKLNTCPKTKEKVAKQRAGYHIRYNTAQPNCVYQIKNLENNKVYIGETIRGELRWKEHLCTLRGNRHQNKLLQEDFDKYGEEAFEWTILKEFGDEDKSVLLLEEARTIQQFITEGAELYNLTLTIDQLRMLTENK
jgi:hypothetical protein